MNSIDLYLEPTDPQIRQIRLFSPICEPIGIKHNPGLILVLYHYANFHLSKTTKVDKSENIHIILILQTNKNFPLIYFDTPCARNENKGLCTVMELPT